jgi:transcriptional regulator with XRE-family HTH domain
MTACSDVSKKKKLDSNDASPSDASGTRQSRVSKIAAFFHDHRIAAGLDQAKVALELGLPSVSVLEDYESGKKAIPLYEIFALTNILNIPPEEVLDLVQELFKSKGAL